MTHKTGPRSKILDRGYHLVCDAFFKLEKKHPTLTVSERLHILHDVADYYFCCVQPWDKERDREFSLAQKTFRWLQTQQMRILKFILRPDEDEMCPTCPKGRANERRA